MNKLKKNIWCQNMMCLLHFTLRKRRIKHYIFRNNRYLYDMRDIFMMYQPLHLNFYGINTKISYHVQWVDIYLRINSCYKESSAKHSVSQF